jgi:hypothetical protein
VQTWKLSNVCKGRIGRVTKIYYLELIRASEGTFNCWFRLQSLAPTAVSRRVDVRQAAGRKNSCRILTQHDKKHVVLTLFSEKEKKQVQKTKTSLVKVEKRKKKNVV